MTTAVERARTYYRAIDEDEYDRLASILAPSFVHRRPDRTIEGRDRFVRFMREERPQKDTSHPVDSIYVAEDAAERAEGDGPAVAVEGRLLDAEGAVMARFLDVFSFANDEIVSIRTYTN